MRRLARRADNWLGEGALRPGRTFGEPGRLSPRIYVDGRGSLSVLMNCQHMYCSPGSAHAPRPSSQWREHPVYGRRRGVHVSGTRWGVRSAARLPPWATAVVFQRRCPARRFSRPAAAHQSSPSRRTARAAGQPMDPPHTTRRPGARPARHGRDAGMRRWGRPCGPPRSHPSAGRRGRRPETQTRALRWLER